jgi:putative ABC transport system permease protein
VLRLAFRNLFQNKIRLMISVGGVTLALMLLLALDAVVVGMAAQTTLYIDHSGADIFVSQEGVRNMHMASSAIPLSVKSRVKAVPGVEAATPILYTTNVVVMGEERNLAYIIGVPKDAEMGSAWHIAVGDARLATKQAIIDRGVAEQSGVGLGDKVKILGQEFVVAGLSEGTANFVNSVAFISHHDFAQLRGDEESMSFLLVKIKESESPNEVATRIEAYVNDVTAQSRMVFAAQERKVINDMSTDIVTIMNLVGFLIGLAVMALTVYTATLARRAEYGVLKALGARNEHLYRVVLAQALISITLGFVFGLAFTWLLSAIVPSLGLNLAMQISGESLVKVGGVSLLIAGIAAVLPIQQIAGLDPARVFRGK